MFIMLDMYHFKSQQDNKININQNQYVKMNGQIWKIFFLIRILFWHDSCHS